MLIVLGVIVVILIAVSLGVWIRLVYLRRQTVVTTTVPVPVTSYPANPRGFVGYLQY